MSATIQSAGKVLDVLNVLIENFAHGLTPTDISRACQIPASAVTRYVQTLEEKGFAERVPETGRIRPSIRFGRMAASIFNSLNEARRRMDELHSRLTTSTL